MGAINTNSNNGFWFLGTSILIWFSVNLEVSEPTEETIGCLLIPGITNRGCFFVLSNRSWPVKLRDNSNLAATLRIGAEVLVFSPRAAFLVNSMLQGKNEDEALRSIWWHDLDQHHASWRVMRSDHFYTSGFRCIYRRHTSWLVLELV